jgi:hypothetical protein
MDGWSAYEKLVLDKLDGLNGRMNTLEDSLVLVRIDVAKLKVKAGIWGATAGMIPALLALAAGYMGRH